MPRAESVRLVEEDAAEVLLVREYLILQRQVGAAGIDQVDAGQMILARDLLRAQVLLDGHRVIGAALDGRIVGDDHAFAAADAADAGDDAGSGHFAAIHVVGGQRAEFQKRRARIEQQIDAIARQQLAARRDGARAPLPCRPARRSRAAFAQLLHQRAHRRWHWLRTAPRRGGFWIGRTITHGFRPRATVLQRRKIMNLGSFLWSAGITGPKSRAASRSAARLGGVRGIRAIHCYAMPTFCPQDVRQGYRRLNMPLDRRGGLHNRPVEPPCALQLRRAYREPAQALEASVSTISGVVRGSATMVAADSDSDRAALQHSSALSPRARAAATAPWCGLASRACSASRSSAPMKPTGPQRQAARQPEPRSATTTTARSSSAASSALWRNQAMFEVQFFHRGFAYDRRVNVTEVGEDGVLRPVNYNPSQFELRQSAAAEGSARRSGVCRSARALPAAAARTTRMS